MWSARAFLDLKSVRKSDCLPRIPKKPSTWLSHDALVGVKWNRTSGFSSSQRAVWRRVVEDHVKLSLGAVLAAALVPSHDR
jgi:hypothetical protein